MSNEERTMAILRKYTTKPNLIKHAMAVSAVMRHFARLKGEREEYWATVGLLHDIDYEQYPDEHCERLVNMLRNEGFDDQFIRSIQSHGYEICTDVEPQSYMENILATVDQLSGFVIACALIRPEKLLSCVTLESMQKRWAIPSFASGTDRNRIMRQCERLGVTWDYMAQETLKGMMPIANKLGV